MTRKELVNELDRITDRLEENGDADDPLIEPARRVLLALQASLLFETTQDLAADAKSFMNTGTMKGWNETLEGGQS